MRPLYVAREQLLEQGAEARARVDKAAHDATCFGQGHGVCQLPESRFRFISEELEQRGQHSNVKGKSVIVHLVDTFSEGR
jgi:hypothetical protein